MPRYATIATLAALLTASLAAPAASPAQEVRVYTRPGAERIVRVGDERPMIGITTGGPSERADTLGLRIEAVTKDSPAAKAGLKAGDRLQAVGSVSLRADRADAGEPDYAGVLHRRLQRVVEGTKPGESLELRVLSDGRMRTVRVTPVKASELEESPARALMRAFPGADRPVLGLTLGSSGSPRDTIGVFVQAVTAAGPAERAGIIEGDRIAAINGVSVRVARADADDREVGGTKVARLEREIAKLEVGDVAELTVVSAGRTRTVRVTAVKASDLPGWDTGAYFFRRPGSEGAMFRFDGEPLRLRLPELRERMQELAPRIEELRRRMETEGNARIQPLESRRRAI
jgi:serine protease Do